MPRDLDLSADDFAVTPWNYPGDLVASSGLVCGGVFFGISTVPERRLGQARVDERETEESQRLNYRLLRANAAGVDQRFLVLAVGSNASPAVLRRKFARAGTSTTVPLITAKVTGIGVGHSAHVSDPGYIAATPYAAGGSAHLVASLLDPDQLACLDSTEPNYERILLDATASPVELDGGECPAAAYIYVSKWGVLREPGGSFVNLESQHRLFERLTAHAGPLEDMAQGHATKEFMRTLAADESLREKVRDRLSTAGWAVSSGLSGESDAPRRAYGATASTWRDSGSADTYVCLPTPDNIARHGEQCVTMHPDEQAGFGAATHAVVRSERSSISAVVRLTQDDSISRGTVGVDQVVRNAMGIETQEHVSLTPAQTPRSRLGDVLLSRPHFSMCRVQPADLATVEQDVALMDPLAMSILGLQPGDEIVVQGVPRTAPGVPEIRLSAHSAPDETVARRERLSGGSLASRFPSARDALGVHPDLPWIFLDATSRNRLGVNRTKLSVVRVRASRRFQLVREVRELTMLLLFAFIGLVTIIDSKVALGFLLGGLTLATLWVMRHRLRSRLQTERSHAET